MNWKKTRNTVGAFVGAVLVTLSTASPALAASTQGGESCGHDKQVYIYTVTRGDTRIEFSYNQGGAIVRSVFYPGGDPGGFPSGRETPTGSFEAHYTVTAPEIFQVDTNCG